MFSLEMLTKQAKAVSAEPEEAPRTSHREAVFTPVLQIAVVMLLWALVRRRVLFGIIPN